MNTPKHLLYAFQNEKLQIHCKNPSLQNIVTFGKHYWNGLVMERGWKWNTDIVMVIGIAPHERLHQEIYIGTKWLFPLLIFGT